MKVAVYNELYVSSQTCPAVREAYCEGLSGRTASRRSMRSSTGGSNTDRPISSARLASCKIIPLHHHDVIHYTFSIATIHICTCMYINTIISCCMHCIMCRYDNTFALELHCCVMHMHTQNACTHTQNTLGQKPSNTRQLEGVVSPTHQIELGWEARVHKFEEEVAERSNLCPACHVDTLGAEWDHEREVGMGKGENG